MAHEALQAVVGTAIVDSAFRQSLLRRSNDLTTSVARRFELSPEEAEIIGRIQADTFEDFAQELNCWISSRATSHAVTVS